MHVAEIYLQIKVQIDEQGGGIAGVIRTVFVSVIPFIYVLSFFSCADSSIGRDDGGPPDANVTGVCGNGEVEGAEECDDGNRLDGDGCDPSCRIEQGWSCSGEPSVCEKLCGNGALDPGEQCEGENLGGNDCTTITGDFSGGTLKCSPNCLFDTTSCIPVNCGNEILDEGEECDNGDQNSNTEPDTCRLNCRLPWCGDGVTDSGEECDDGNSVSGDGCEPDCTFTCNPGQEESCGSCGKRTCQSNRTWGPCLEYCEGRECGPDLCGGTCGSCSNWWYDCNGAGTCTSPCANPPCLADVCSHPDIYVSYAHSSSPCAVWAAYNIGFACGKPSMITGCDNGTCAQPCADGCSTCSQCSVAYCPPVNPCTNCNSSFLTVDHSNESAQPNFSEGVLIAAGGALKDWVFRNYFFDPLTPNPSVCPLVLASSSCLESPCGSDQCIAGSEISNNNMESEAVFHLEILPDGDVAVFIASSVVARGGLAAATLFNSVIVNNLVDYTDRWYVYHWQDGDGDGIPDAPPVDTYTLLQSGN